MAKDLIKEFCSRSEGLALGVSLHIITNLYNYLRSPPLGRVNKRGNIIFLDFKKAHMFKCKIYMYRN
jgi:hypothetical protein